MGAMVMAMAMVIRRQGCRFRRLAWCHSYRCHGLFQCQGPLCACAGLVPVSLTKGLTGLACCIQTSPTPPPPHPPASQDSLLYCDCWTGGAWPLIWLAATPLLLFRSRYLTAGLTHSIGIGKWWGLAGISILCEELGRDLLWNLLGTFLGLSGDFCKRKCTKYYCNKFLKSKMNKKNYIMGTIQI